MVILSFILECLLTNAFMEVDMSKQFDEWLFILTRKPFPASHISQTNLVNVYRYLFKEPKISGRLK